MPGKFWNASRCLQVMTQAGGFVSLPASLSAHVAARHSAEIAAPHILYGKPSRKQHSTTVLWKHDTSQEMSEFPPTTTTLLVWTPKKTGSVMQGSLQGPPVYGKTLAGLAYMDRKMIVKITPATSAEL